MKLLKSALLFVLAVPIVHGLYRLTVAALRWLGTKRWTGKIVEADTSKGIDRFRLTLGDLFSWNVSVNWSGHVSADS